jgi:cation transport ATPase
VLVSDTRVLETIRKVDVVVLDKTGTATIGEFTLLDTVGDTSRMAELAAIEARSEHPLAKAVAKGHGSGLSATEVTIHQGMGISGVVVGVRYFIGNRRLMEVLGTQYSATPRRCELLAATFQPSAPEEPSGPAKTLAFNKAGRAGNVEALLDPPRSTTDISEPGVEISLDAAGKSACGTTAYFGWDGAVRGVMTFGDRIRPDAAELCENLRRRGVRTLLLSGDSTAATSSTAEAIGADSSIAEATPDRKVEIIRDLQRSGEVVAMIGDGVNDAPSLAQADLGIALGSGADIAMQAAPLVLMGASLAGVIETLDLARRTFRIVRQNLFWAFAYNVIGMALAVTGVLNPIMAAAAMVLSSLSVIGNSRRLG